MLTTLLGTILATVWAGLCRPVRDASARCRLALQANLAVTTLARDLGGFLINPNDDTGRVDSRTGSSSVGRLAGVKLSSSDPTFMQIGYLDNSGNKTRVTYQLQTGAKLLRTYDTDTTGLVVAAEVQSFNVATWAGAAGHSGIEITMTFNSSEKATRTQPPNAPHDLSMSYDLVVRVPVLADDW